MKKRTFFLFSFLSALLLLLITALIVLAAGYRFHSYKEEDGFWARTFGKGGEGTVYYADRRAAYSPDKLVYSDGDVYEGELKNYRPSGQGVYTFACGDRIEGTFAQGKAEGPCLLLFADGSTLEADFHQGQPQGIATLTLCYDDGSQERLQGEIFALLSEGKLTYSYRNGTNYIGGYSRGMASGSGSLTFSNGDSYVGSFLDGEFSVYGTYTYADGSVYQGAFAHGLPNGKGTYTYDFNGIPRVASGVFYNGRWIGPGEETEAESAS